MARQAADLIKAESEAVVECCLSVRLDARKSFPKVRCVERLRSKVGRIAENYQSVISVVSLFAKELFQSFAQIMPLLPSHRGRGVNHEDDAREYGEPLVSLSYDDEGMS